ncbi:MAG: hypothetical protein J0M37_12305 [Ignavibacteria bacterium]|nr:hypothetical protein [Ignavibacteria bacterium]
METNAILNEILKWQKLQGIAIIRELIPKLLDESKKKLVYEMTDGKNSQATISKKTGVAGGTISNWWNLWYSYGILTKGQDNRYNKIISLKELGINV